MHDTHYQLICGTAAGDRPRRTVILSPRRTSVKGPNGVGQNPLYLSSTTISIMRFESLDRSRLGVAYKNHQLTASHFCRTNAQNRQSLNRHSTCTTWCYNNKICFSTDCCIFNDGQLLLVTTFETCQVSMLISVSHPSGQQV